jgi:hypothetical protein
MVKAEQDPQDGQVPIGMVGTEQRSFVRTEDEIEIDELVRLAKEKEKQLWECLDGTKRRLVWDNEKPLRLSWDSRRPRSNHPVATLHLMQIASHIHSILYHLKPPVNKLANNEPGRASLRSLLEQLDDPVRLSRDSAWELSGEFERQLITLGDDTYLYTLLRDQLGSAEQPRSGPKRIPTIADWKDYFPVDDLQRLCSDYEGKAESSGDNGTLSKVGKSVRERLCPNNAQTTRGFSDEQTRSEVREYLRHLHLVRSEEYRRDRAKIRLRARYLARVAPLLMVLLILLCGSYLLVSSPNTYVFELLGWPSSTDLIPLRADQIPLVDTNGNPLNSGGSNGTPAPPSEQPMPFPAYLLVFVFSAGALGGILSRAYRLGRESLRVGTEPPANEASIGIRALLSEGKSLMAQAAMGGTAAIIIYLVLQLFAAPDFPLVGYGLLGFFAGYSEPFFTRMLQETAGIGQRYSGV